MPPRSTSGKRPFTKPPVLIGADKRARVVFVSERLRPEHRAAACESVKDLANRQAIDTQLARNFLGLVEQVEQLERALTVEAAIRGKLVACIDADPGDARDAALTEALELSAKLPTGAAAEEALVNEERMRCAAIAICTVASLRVAGADDAALREADAREEIAAKILNP